ncbi:hypothetical protein ETB97_006021 [Aspergillus alliaceus]|uniref:Uncharacterized protein n=1 Tax=Petromyces alliaceus TaxID=209559 RepID=A0A8H5ZXU0_PETAA|nr:hypothetical protein ETB97_006021 [Aspergillus burnettii]
MDALDRMARMTPSRRSINGRDIHRPVDSPEALVLKAWGQGLMVGALFVMTAVTYANMRASVMHKLIILEVLLLALPHGAFAFVPEPAYGRYLLVTAVGLIISWSLHNVIAWMKDRPFVSRSLSIIYFGTVALVQPYCILEMYANFAYFNNIEVAMYEKIRPWEALFRYATGFSPHVVLSTPESLKRIDHRLQRPWWIYTACNIFWVIKRHYSFGAIELIREAPRFGLMPISICLSIVFMLLDLSAVTGVIRDAVDRGINPFWKLCLVFKCLCGMIILDDFKTALDKLSARWRSRQGVAQCLSPVWPPRLSTPFYRVQRFIVGTVSRAKKRNHRGISRVKEQDMRAKESAIEHEI